MKTQIHRHLLIIALLLLPTWAVAQSSTIPSTISYQGRVLDSSGNPVGTGTPVNRTVIFRIWDHPSNTQVANLIYSEQQTVTIADGEFSVLLGQGNANGTQTFSYSETAKGPPTVSLPNAFNGSTRYLGVTVAAAATIALTDNEITPRQQIVSSAFALRAKEAETLTSAVNITSGTLADARLSTNVSLFGQSIEAAEITNGNVTAAKLGADVGVWSVSGANVFRSSGNVGIGNVPSVALDVTGAVKASTSITAGTSIKANGTSGFSFSTGDLDGGIFSPGDGMLSFKTNNEERMLFNSAGNANIHGDLSTANIVTGNLNAARVAANGTSGFGFRTGDTDGGIFSPADGLMTFSTDGVEKMRINNVGNVLIGNTGANPGNKLQIIQTLGSNDAGAMQHSLQLQINGVGNKSLGIGVLDNGRGVIQAKEIGVGYQALLLNPAGGLVGIGTSDPKAGLDVVPSPGLSLTRLGYVANTGFNDSDATTNWLTSIRAADTIAAQYFVVTSDERIKNVRGRSNGAEDLQSLLGIEITDYTMKEQSGRSDAQVLKKVIAQQVETVYPRAVRKGLGTVLDIMKMTTIQDGWIDLATNLKVGERVRLICNNEDGVREVLEIDSEKKRFRTDFKSADGKVLVYGREVKDFRTVDYDAISMLNVSATQQIKKEKDAEVSGLREENTKLRARVAALEAQSERVAALESRDQAITAKLAALEKLLMATGKADVIPVSVNRSTASEQ